MEQKFFPRVQLVYFWIMPKSRHLVDASRKVMYPGPWQLDSVDSSSTWCFAPPLPVGGMMVLGGRELARFDFGLAGRKARTWRIVIPARKLIGFSPMADARCLVIADESGIATSSVSLLTKRKDGRPSQIYHLQMDVEACEFSVLFRLDAMRPSCITALKCDYYFIGSAILIILKLRSACAVLLNARACVDHLNIRLHLLTPHLFK
mmetsp:Transcript_15644/g.46935  ORF Transcript_15644/g.46935 Transcript_15644/m.46935 type:complete len:206 (+) Transcript_15644:774-1391(+)